MPESFDSNPMPFWGGIGAEAEKTGVRMKLSSEGQFEPVEPDLIDAGQVCKGLEQDPIALSQKCRGHDLVEYERRLTCPNRFRKELVVEG